LLLRGAATDVKDNKGRTPLDLVEEYKDMQLAQEVRKLLVRDAK